MLNNHTNYIKWKIIKRKRENIIKKDNKYKNILMFNGIGCTISSIIDEQKRKIFENIKNNKKCDLTINKNNN